MKRNSEAQNEIEPSPFGMKSQRAMDIKGNFLSRTHGNVEKLEIIPQNELVRQSSMEANIEERLNIHTKIPEPNRASS